MTHISGLNVVDGVYGPTTLTSGVQQGDAQNAQSLPYDTDVLASSVSATGKAIAYEYSPL